MVNISVRESWRVGCRLANRVAVILALSVAHALSLVGASVGYVQESPHGSRIPIPGFTVMRFSCLASKAAG